MTDTARLRELAGKLRTQINSLSGAANTAYNMKQVKASEGAPKLFGRISKALDDAMPVLREAALALDELDASKARIAEVKPLEWKPAQPGPAFYATTILGHYAASAFTQLMPKRTVWRWRPNDEAKWSAEAFDGEAPAKAAAQKDYEQRILSALEPKDAC
jgi:hypothetical protein